MRGRTWLARLALVLGSSLFALLLAEVLARGVAARGDAELLYTAPEVVPRGFYLTDRTLLMKPAPEQDAWSRTLAGTVRLRTNQEGLRGGPVAEDERPRWLAVGDSFTFALQVPEEDSFAGRLTDAKRQVLNAGVDGYAPSQALARYEQLAEAVDSSGVLFTLFLGNDLIDELDFPDRKRKARGTIPNRPIPLPTTSAVSRILMRSSALFVRLRVSQQALANGPVARANRDQWRRTLTLFTEEGRRDREAAVDALRPTLQRFQAAAATHGDALLVAVAPPSFAIHPDRLDAALSLVGLRSAGPEPSAPSAAVLRLLSELGVPSCDLTPALVDAAEAAPLYFQWDGHWTAEGHAVVADQLRRCWQEHP